MKPLPDPVVSEAEIVPPRKLAARVVAVFVASSGTFETRAVDALNLGFEGIEGDFHAGHTRFSGGREPWYRRGTEIRNGRQLSIVAPDELATIAKRMGVVEVRPEWIGANLLVEGVPNLSMLPPGALLFFAGGATLRIDARNGPCRVSGRAIARNADMEDADAGSLLFPKVARRLRGLVAWVEKPGRVLPGEGISVHVPEQWIWRAVR